jgi:hypothetical protein
MHEITWWWEHMRSELEELNTAECREETVDGCSPPVSEEPASRLSTLPPPP